MSYTASKADMESIRIQNKRNPVAKYLRNIANNKFSIGDILNMQIMNYEDTWGTQMISEKTTVPAKYIYIHEDNLGIGYVKKYTADCSRVSDGVLSLAEMNLDRVRFVVDSDYADHMLLNADQPFNISAKFDEAKKTRERVKKLNAKIAISGTREEILSSFKKGDRFWHSWDLSCLRAEEHEVKSIKRYKPKDTSNWASHRKLVIKTRTISDNMEYEFDCGGLGFFYKTKPHMLGEQL